MITGNKGEWSEIYALLKVLSDTKLIGGNSNLEKIETLIFPIIKILREESNGTFEFSYNKDIVFINKNNNQTFRIPITEFRKKAAYLLKILKSQTSRTFAIPEIEAFINSYNSKSIKAQSNTKSDLRIIIHDQRTGLHPELGFSIKSQLGGASTLLNAGQTTNFIYNIKGSKLSDDTIKTINLIDSRSKIKDRIKAIQCAGGFFIFHKTENSIFGNNLMLIDSALPQIISEALFLFFSSDLSKSTDLIKEVSLQNPIKFDTTSEHPYYSYKFKRFLTDVALGMMPSKVWQGQLDATGGYLIIKEDGDILCYHIYNRNEFEDYLFTNTKFETASSSRHGFGLLYKENNQLYFKLNLQIRFVS